MPSDFSRVVITGANRGLGLGFVQHYLEQGAQVVATARRPESASDLQALRQEHSSSLTIEACDVADPASIEALAAAIPWDGIDLLINNSGVFGAPSPSLLDVEFDVLEETMAINAYGPLRVTRALWPRLVAGKATLAFMTSLMGSIEDASGGRYEYRMSKCALNMGVHCLAKECPPGMIAFVMHPGWVRTDMGGSAAPLSTEESVGAMVRTIGSVTPEHGGRFLDRDGASLPW